MNISARLALSGLKTTLSRTIWTITAIILSTALIMTVASFIVSINTMLLDFFGSDYGEYAATYMTILLIPAILFGIIVIAMSVIIISNVFTVSARERTLQFGILKCVGATKKQITTTVLYESLFLSLVGIPLGIILGLILTFLGINIANTYLVELNSLVHMMLFEIQLSLRFVFSWWAVLCSVVICFSSVILSAWVPSRKAAKASAVESVRGNYDVKTENKNLTASPIIENIFGFEGVFAQKNIKSSRRQFRSTIINLSVGVILFISLSFLSTQAQAIKEYMMPKIDESIITEYTSARDWKINEKTGREESILLSPIDSELGNTIAKELKEYNKKEVFGIGNDLETYHTVLSEKYMTEDFLSALNYPRQNDHELSVEIITLDDNNYRKLCEAANVSYGSNILINHYSYNDNGKEVHITPYKAFDRVTLIKADESKNEIKIHGTLTMEQMPKELFYFNTNLIRIIVPQSTVRSYAWYTSPKNEEDYMAYANEVMAKYFPEKEDATYMESGFNTTVYKISDYSRVMNIAISLATVFMYSFVILLMLMGFTNVISTVSTNILIRAKEFAVLKSVGMTQKSLRKMLSLESMLCSAKALLYGLPIGLLMTYLINRPLRHTYPIPYKLPLITALICASFLFLLTWIITVSSLAKLKHQNIIETIRAESGR